MILALSADDGPLLDRQQYYSIGEENRQTVWHNNNYILRVCFRVGEFGGVSVTMNLKGLICIDRSCCIRKTIQKRDRTNYFRDIDGAGSYLGKGNPFWHSFTQGRELFFFVQRVIKTEIAIAFRVRGVVLQFLIIGKEWTWVHLHIN